MRCPVGTAARGSPTSPRQLPVDRAARAVAAAAPATVATQHDREHRDDEQRERRRYAEARASSERYSGYGTGSVYRAAEAIIAALSVQSASGASAASGRARPQLRVGGDAADDRDRARRSGGLDPPDERAHDRPLVARGEVGAPRLELAGVQVAHRVEQRGLQPGEREVEPRHAGDREVVRLRVALAGEHVDLAPARDSRARAAAHPCRTPRRRRRRASSRAPR